MFVSPVGGQIGWTGDTVFYTHVTLWEKYLQIPACGALKLPTRLVVVERTLLF